MPTNHKHPEDYVKNLEQAKSVEVHELKIYMAKAVFSILTISFISFNLLFLFLIYKNNATISTSNYIDLFKSLTEVLKIAIGAS
jgi:hypothetical protein